MPSIIKSEMTNFPIAFLRKCPQNRQITNFQISNQNQK